MRNGFENAGAGKPRRTRHAAAVGLVALLCSVALPGVAQDRLSGDQIRELITGNTLQGSYTTLPLTMVFYEDGVLRGSIGLTGSDSGTWEIEGDTYCNEWVVYFDGVRRCYAWVPNGNGYVLQNVDAYKIRPIQGRIEQGKPKGY